MPIDIDEFDSESTDGLGGEDGSDQSLVLEFLGLNSDAAFSRGEIAEATGLSGVKLFLLLADLEDRGLVRHRGEYWAIGEGYDPLEEFAADAFGEPDSDGGSG